MKKLKTILLCLCIILGIAFGLQGCSKEEPKDEGIKVEEGYEEIAKDETQEDSNNSKPQEVPPVVKEDGDTVVDNTKKEEIPKVEEKKKEVTFSITCHNILKNSADLDEEKKEFAKNGVIVDETKIELVDSDKTVFDILYKVTRSKRIHLDFGGGKVSPYIKGINNIYEFDCGAESGWMYKVNGKVESIGIGQFTIKDGDKIEIIYTCNLGGDI